MAHGQRLYERAATQSAGLDALWHLDATHTLFVGPLHFNGSHQHGAPVFLAGLYGPFGLRVRKGEWLTCRTAVIPAGVSHELDVGGNPIAVLYVEPNRACSDLLTPLVGNARETDGVLVGSAGAIVPMRELYEDRGSLSWMEAALTDLAGFAERHARKAIDPRIARAVDMLRDRHEDLTLVAALAEEVRLSPSRFQHLFSECVGVPFRRYRAWARMRAAIAEIVAGANFTTAAHAAGFFDQAHFAHDFRCTFGAPASVSLSNVRPASMRRTASNSNGCE
jgi:AraC-like DNA-binding protein